jgi:ABC-type nitrate/sulfonate/bicarbonate transport system permease component
LPSRRICISNPSYGTGACVDFATASERLYRSVEFIIDFFRSMPPWAMFPLFPVLFGVGDCTKIAVAAFGAGLVVLFSVAYGVMNARKTRRLVATVMGATPLRVLIPRDLAGIATANFW